MSLRSFAFACLLAAGLAPALVMLLQFHDVAGAGAYDWGGATATLIVAAAPVVIDDLSFFGVVTPLVAATALAALAPGKGERTATVITIALCAFGWLTYASLTMSLAVGTDFFKAVQTTLEGKTVADTSRSVAYLQGFAATARVFFLVLGATLVGVSIRPRAAAAALVAIATLAISTPSDAGEIRVEPQGTAFDVVVTLRDGPDALGKAAATDATGAFVFDFGPESFANGAYAERILSISLKPKAEDAPAPGVRQFVLELPIVLRRWRANDVYSIRFAPFEGARPELLKRYELMSGFADRWTKVVASLQQADHIAYRITAANPGARRALNTAVDGWVTILKAEQTGWLLTPIGLYERLERSHNDVDDAKLASLEQALHHADSLIWKDLPSIEKRLKPADCADVAATFDYLALRKDANERAYALQLPHDVALLAKKREAAERACAAGPP